MKKTIVNCSGGGKTVVRRRILRRLGVGLLLVGLRGGAAAATWYVAPDGDDGAHAGTNGWGDAFLTISNAVRLASAPDDVVQVSNGTYMVSTEITLNKAIRVTSVNGPEWTIISALYPDPAHSSRCVTVSSVGAMFDGFSVTNGYPNRGDGGGVRVTAGVVSNCFIMFNGYDSCVRGGGLYLNSSNAMATDCMIVSNTQTYASVGGGGGVYMIYDAILRNSTVADNTSRLQGGGVYVTGGAGGAAIVSNCVISGNGHSSANLRGAGMAVLAPVRIVDCLISNNTRYSLVGGISIELGVDAYIVGTTVTCNKGTMAGGLATLRAYNTFISNCVISYNESDSGAGGIYHGYNSGEVGSMTVTHSRIIGNLATNNSGGGVYFKTNGVLEYCEVVSNSSMRSGGGVFIEPQTQAQIRNCLILGNSTTSAVSYHYGGGVYIGADGTNTVESCTIVGNQALGSSGGGGMALVSAAGNQVYNTIISSNSSGAGDNDLYLEGAGSTNAFYYSCSPVLTNQAQGNITNSPIFIAPGAGYGVNLQSGNYRLTSGSPCVHTGTNQSWMVGAGDLDGRSRLDRLVRRTDMGCYEHIPRGAMFGIR